MYQRKVKVELTSSQFVRKTLGATSDRKYLIKRSERPGNQENHQKRKLKHTYPRYIDRDVRAPEDRNPKDEEYLRQFTKKMCQLKTDAPAVILSLLKRLHYTSEAPSELDNEPFNN